MLELKYFVLSHFFGSKLDVHTGGIDLMFPHHENEEAQCCARFGVHNWVSHWLHFGKQSFIPISGGFRTFSHIISHLQVTCK